MNSLRPVVVDFHVHTPLSRCHDGSAWSLESFVASALRAGLDAVLVTDHHTSENAWRLADEARRTGLSILPGMELTTADGHLLVAFNPEGPENAWEHLLSAVGLPPQHRGNGSHVLSISMLDAVREADSLGAFCIPAHIDRWPNGFLERPNSFKVRAAIVASPSITAVEITLPHTQVSWEAGAMPPFTRRLACVRGSDAHGLAELGRRPTWLLSAGTSFADVRRALSEPGFTRLSPPCGEAVAP